MPKRTLQDRLTWTLLVTAILAVTLGGLFWLSDAGTPAAGPALTGTTSPADKTGPVLRIGLTPERDIFQQRKRYRMLADYLAGRLGRPVELATVNTYEAVLQDLADKKIDGAFVGSLVAVLAMDRLEAWPLVKPQNSADISSYRGVVFVRDDSPITSIQQLAGHSVAMVRTTTAANLFPSGLMVKAGLTAGPRAPKTVWVGTHDDVAEEVMAGRVDVGATKDSRLDDLLRSHPQWKIRRLAVSEPVPENALILRSDVAKELGDTLGQLLLKMHEDAQGRQTLLAMQLKCFLPCGRADYQAVYDMIEQLGPAWGQLGVDGPAPRRPQAASRRAP